MACSIYHEQVETTATCQLLLQLSYYSPPCTHQQTGVCKELDCPYKHDLEEIKECNMYKLGFCIYGPQCRYKHKKMPGERFARLSVLVLS